MKKILLLEDEEILGSIYRKYLKIAGYEVKWIKLASETKKAISNFKADLILLDHGIKNDLKSGIDVIPIIKKALPACKIVVISNYSVFDMKEKAMRAGADDYLVKVNYKIKDLLNYIKNIN